MYLRKIKNQGEEYSCEPVSLVGIVMLTIVLLAVIIMTSVSNTGLNYLKLADSLNTQEMMYFDFAAARLKHRVMNCSINWQM